ncbi:MAG: hypothetical protein ACJASC_003085 [Limimaricola cinnabarinus]|jgi:hypothetical protein|uniref:hypothetical protein n=1 Tax=Limimaricola cinnabarinus TaxID=1125964 RepID=UPI0039E45B0C
MTSPRGIARAAQSANDDRPPEIRVERIGMARLIEALCEAAAIDCREGRPARAPSSDAARSVHETDVEEPVAPHLVPRSRAKGG